MWLNIHINIHSGDDKININNQPIQINWVGFKATCQRMVLWSSGKPCSEGLPPWACRMAGPCCSCNGRPGTLPFKFPVAEARTQLQVLMFGLATWIKNLEACLKHLCVVVEQGKGRKEISFHPLPWYCLSPTKGFPQVSWFREPREVAIKKLCFHSLSHTSPYEL